MKKKPSSKCQFKNHPRKNLGGDQTFTFFAFLSEHFLVGGGGRTGNLFTGRSLGRLWLQSGSGSAQELPPGGGTGANKKKFTFMQTFAHSKKIASPILYGFFNFCLSKAALHFQQLVLQFKHPKLSTHRKM